MSNHFDEVAELYDSLLAPLPKEYIQLIWMHFNLSKYDRVIDLGCGSGLLTIPLARLSSHVEGLDSSEKLLKIARSRDTHKRVRWIHSPAEEFDFGREKYKLIISFEAFHLFNKPEELIRKCSLALKVGGYLCVGWIIYHWEQSLKDIIIDVFASNGIMWGEWGYWSCPKFADLVKHGNFGLSSVVQKTLMVDVSSHIKDIVLYLTSIDIAAPLKPEARVDLAQELETKLRSALSSEWIRGVSLYTIAYSQKVSLI